MATIEAPLPTTGPTWHADDASHPRKWAILASILGVQMLNVLGVSIVNVGAPSIATELHASSTALQWIVGGYSLTFAIGLITGGRLGDIYGRRRLFQIGIVVFTITSLACGLASSPVALIVFRLLQGFGAALMIPQSFGMVRQTFARRELLKAMSFWGPTMGLGFLLGPVLGGLIVEADVLGSGWRGVFLVNVPFGLLGLLAATTIIPDYPHSARPGDSLDLKGAAITGLAAGMVIFSLIEGREADWPAWIFAIGLSGVALIIAFSLYERRRERLGQATLIVTSIFRKRAYVAGLALIATIHQVMTGLLLVVVLFLQLDQGFEPMHAGLTMVPWAIGGSLGSASTNWWRPRIGRHVIHVGNALSITGVGLMLYVLSRGGDLTTLELAGPLFVIGLGAGTSTTPIFAFGMAVIEGRELGSASGVMSAIQQFAMAASVAILGTIFFSVAESDDMRAALETCLVYCASLFVIVAGVVFLLPPKVKDGGGGGGF